MAIFPKRLILTPTAIVVMALLPGCATQPGADAASDKGPAPETAAIKSIDKQTLAQSGVPAFCHCLVNWSGAMQSTLVPWTRLVEQCDTRRNGN